MKKLMISLGYDHIYSLFIKNALIMLFKEINKMIEKIPNLANIKTLIAEYEPRDIPPSKANDRNGNITLQDQLYLLTVNHFSLWKPNIDIGVRNSIVQEDKLIDNSLLR